MHNLLDKKWPVLFSTLAVLGVTAWAYALAYLFEYGYFSYFGVPSDFIQITPIRIIFAVLVVLASVIVISYYGFIAIESFFRSKRYTRVKEMVFLWLIFFLIFVGIPYIAGQHFAARILAVCIAIIAFIGFIRLLCTKGRTLEEKIINMEKKNAFLDKPFVFVENFLGTPVTFTILFILVTFGISIVVGSGMASMKTIFPTIQKDNLSFAVVRIYGNEAIAMPLNREQEELSPEVKLLDLQSVGSEYNLLIEALGQLHVASRN